MGSFAKPPSVACMIGLNARNPTLSRGLAVGASVLPRKSKRGRLCFLGADCEADVKLIVQRSVRYRALNSEKQTSGGYARQPIQT
jgi:hypothetical protein